MRDPKAIEHEDLWGHHGYGGDMPYWRRTQSGGWSLDDDDRHPTTYPSRHYTSATRTWGPHPHDSLLDLVADWPEEVADYLEQMGVDPHVLADHIEQVRGIR